MRQVLETEGGDYRLSVRHLRWSVLESNIVAIEGARIPGVKAAFQWQSPHWIILPGSNDFIAKLGKSAKRDELGWWREGGLGCKAEEFGDESGFCHHVFLRYRSNSSLADHVERFNAVEGSPRTVKRVVALGQPSTLFHGPVVLFDHVVEKLTLA